MQASPSLAGRARKTRVRSGYLYAAVAFVFVLLALATALTKRPECDEAWFASPAHTLITKGYMATPVLEPANLFPGGNSFRGLDRHTYWIMPLHPLVQAAWYEIAGFGLLQMRLLSIAWGMVALAAWYFILREQAHDAAVPLLACFLMAVDYAFVRGAAHGRMDMMCAALGFSGIALYLKWRESALWKALLFANIMVAASLFTHPNGMLAAMALGVVALSFDRRRLRPRHVLLSAIPYVIAAAAWGVYIMQAPDVFSEQFRGNASGRFSGLAAPLVALKAEIMQRYLAGGSYSKALIMLPSAAGILAALAIPAIRRNRIYRAFLIIVGLCFVYDWLLENRKLYFYVIQFVPYCIALLAASAVYLWRSARMLRPAIAAVITLLVLIDAGGVALVLRRDDLHRSYGAAAAYVKRNAGPDDLIMASGELGFAVGFTDRLIDDPLLGCQSGKVPQWVVIEQRMQQILDGPSDHHACMMNLLARSDLVYDRNAYRIYRVRR